METTNAAIYTEPEAATVSVNTTATKTHRRPWQFKVGQCVSHEDQSMPSLVLSRFRAGNAKGNKLELYGVRSFAANDPHRDRLMVGDCLVDVVPGTGPCQDCLLYNTGMCPGDKR